MMNFQNRMDMPPRHTRRRRIASRVAFGLLIGISIFLLFGYIVMRLWNSIMPDLLSVHQITYWQSLGLLLLTRILVGGFFGRGHFSRERTLCSWEPRERYERWWGEVGKKSYQDFVESKTGGGTPTV